MILETGSTGVAINDSGPPLGLIYGRVAGSDMHFTRYSHPMLHSIELWSSFNLRKFLMDPNRLIPGTKCGLQPIAEESVAVDLVQFLKELTLANYSFIRSMVVIYYN